jgi:cytoskeletal protein RodZ
MDSIGETLRQARHDKRASLEDASRATKIKMDILEKLEADEFGALAAPMYTKGFLKIYAEYLSLDSGEVLNAYLKSQGGLRRQGLHVETEAQIRARKPRELKLSTAGVIRVVGALTLAVVLVVVVRHFWTSRSVTAPAKPTSLPTADFEAQYKPKTKPVPQTLDLTGK